MEYRKKGVVVSLILCCFLLLLAFPVSTVKADTGIQPAAADNLRVGLKRTSALVATDSGFMRVFYDGEKISIEYYDDGFQIQSKRSVEMELDIWGGFYAGPDAYYIVEGRDNEGESDIAEVIRVVKYDTAWNRQGAASITGNPELFGGEVRYPFDYGCVEMAEYNGRLYIVTGHEGYVDDRVGQGHQGFLMIEVNMASMTGRIVDCDLWHSFAQYIKCKDSSLYVLEQSEGSRYTKLSKYDLDNFDKTSVPVFKYGGSRTSAWAVSCYASVDGMALSSSHALCLGTSIDQSGYDSVSSDTAHNIYLTATPLADFTENATDVKWLTDYSGGGKSFLGVKITKVNDSRFLVSWEEAVEEDEGAAAESDDGLSAGTLHYVFIDAVGNKVSREFTEAAAVSDCQPVVKGSQIVYYASNGNMVDFYSIDAQTGGFRKKVYRVAGENASWVLDGNVLTISGTGEIYVEPEAKFRYPVSTVAGAFSYSSGDNAWEPIRDRVEKIVICKGITGISENAFAHFDKLEEVQIEEGVTSIGKQAFYNCGSLNKITIPASVTSIGEDILWTGSYWTHDESHVVRAAIYTPEGSYAADYARKNDIRFEDSSGRDENERISISKAKVTGIKKNYVYNGKARKPKVTVKFGGRVLKKGTDYTVSYEDNIYVGKASVIIKGINGYTGTIMKKFKIVPRK